MATKRNAVASKGKVKKPTKRAMPEATRRKSTVREIIDEVDKGPPEPKAQKQSPPKGETPGAEQAPPGSGSAFKLKYVDFRFWEANPAQPQPWLVDQLIPMDDVTMVAGVGAGGKTTLLMQLATCVVLDCHWLGWKVRGGPAIYLNCEDTLNRLQRRFEGIVKYYNSSLGALAGRLHLLAYSGEDALLGLWDRKNQTIQESDFFDKFSEDAIAIQPAVIIVDNLADVFGADENVRALVRGFITLLRRLALKSHSALVLIAHPSRAGIQNNTGESGSTHWFNSMRAFLHMRGVRPEGMPVDPDLRELVQMKNQDAPLAATKLLRWQSGVYVPDAKAATGSATANYVAEQIFLTLLVRFNEEGRKVGATPGPNYATTVFAKEEDAGGITAKAFGAALSRLLKAGKVRIWTRTEGVPPSRQTAELQVVSGPDERRDDEAAEM